MINKLFLGFLLSVVYISANAGMSVPPTTTYSNASSSSNRVYAGLKWTLHEGTQPEVVVGFRHSKVNSDGDTHGGDASLSMKVFNTFQLGKIRAKYFNGQEFAQGEASGGFDFTKGLFVGASIKAPYSNLGVDYLPKASNAFEPYLIIDTLHKHGKPNSQSNTSCPTGYTLNPSTGQCDAL